MKRFEIAYDRVKIQYDQDYGIDHRKGWSIAIDGSYYVQFEKRLLVALFKAIYSYFELRDEQIRSEG